MVLSTNEICFLCILRLSLFIKHEMRVALLGTPEDTLSKAWKWASATIGALLLGTMEWCLGPSYLEEFLRCFERYAKFPVNRYLSLHRDPVGEPGEGFICWDF